MPHIRKTQSQIINISPLTRIQSRICMCYSSYGWLLFPVSLPHPSTTLHLSIIMWLMKKPSLTWQTGCKCKHQIIQLFVKCVAIINFHDGFTQTLDTSAVLPSDQAYLSINLTSGFSDANVWIIVYSPPVLRSYIDSDGHLNLSIVILKVVSLRTEIADGRMLWTNQHNLWLNKRQPVIVESRK